MPHGPVQRVALHGNSAGFADQPLEVLDVHLLVRRALTLALGDVVPHHGPVEVVAAVAQRDLREPRRLHDPERLDVRDVRRYQARARERLQIRETGWARKVAQLAVFRDEAEGDDAVEAGAGKRRRDRETERRSGRLRIRALRLYVS